MPNPFHLNEAAAGAFAIWALVVFGILCALAALRWKTKPKGKR